MRFSLVVLLIFLTGCSFQMGMSTPRGYYTKEEVESAFQQRDVALQNVVEAIKKLQTEKNAIKGLQALGEMENGKEKEQKK